jgi:putative acetyltransferase
MIQFPGLIRDLKRGEEDAVDALLQAAFEGKDEAALVHKLRKSGEIAGEQVLPMGDEIIGYYAISRMVAPKGWLALAPVAIRPDMQRRGLGRRMMGVLTEWARLTKSPVVVLGNPAFYETAGFTCELADGLTTPYPKEFTMMAGVAAPPSKTLVYSRAFDGV